VDLGEQQPPRDGAPLADDGRGGERQQQQCQERKQRPPEPSALP
jgi:hypothetical protein